MEVAAFFLVESHESPTGLVWPTGEVSAMEDLLEAFMEAASGVVNTNHRGASQKRLDSDSIG